MKKEMNMKIDRHNYEEFFLLYVDDELTATQKNSVDQFVRENPDLAIELELLQQTALQPDDSIVFDGKESLLKSETESIINLNNYEEYIIGYIDGELSGAERMELFKFAETHPQVKEELAIYQQTKLEPEKEIVFANKEILYRKEEVKVIAIRWWKVAVAAAVVLALGITTITVLNKPAAITPGVATNTKQATEKNKPATKTEQAVKQQEQTVPVEIKNTNEEVAAINKQGKQQKEITLPKPVKEKQLDKIASPALLKNNDNTFAQSSNIRSTDKNNSTNKEAISKVIESSATSADATKPGNAIAANTNSAKENINKATVTPKTDEPLNDHETVRDDTNTQPVYASYDEGKNKKLRGFFRKAARVFERRTNISASDDDDKQDKVLIGALAVKLK